MTAGFLIFVLGMFVGFFACSALRTGGEGERISRSDIEVIVSQERRRAYTNGMLDERERVEGKGKGGASE